MIQLTLADTGNPPVAINPGAIVAVKPRKSMKPDVATQGVSVNIAWAGSQVTLPSGVTFNVMEDYDTVLGKVHASMRTPKEEPPAKKAAAKTPEPADA
jgi:hypothetical protein